jgi:hypothetical protein
MLASSDLAPFRKPALNYPVFLNGLVSCCQCLVLTRVGLEYGEEVHWSKSLRGWSNMRGSFHHGPREMTIQWSVDFVTYVKNSKLGNFIDV